MVLVLGHFQVMWYYRRLLSYYLSPWLHSWFWVSGSSEMDVRLSTCWIRRNPPLVYSYLKGLWVADPLYNYTGEMVDPHVGNCIILLQGFETLAYIGSPQLLHNSSRILVSPMAYSNSTRARCTSCDWNRLYTVRKGQFVYIFLNECGKEEPDPHLAVLYGA